MPTAPTVPSASSASSASAAPVSGNAAGKQPVRQKKVARKATEPALFDAGVLHSCVVCCTDRHTVEALKYGVFCHDVHYTCGDCVRKLVKDSLVREPEALDAPEKAEQRYHVKCMSTSECCGVFDMRSLARVLSCSEMDEYVTRTVQLGVHLQLPDAAREFAASTAACNAAPVSRSAEQEMETVRAAFRRRDGTFRDQGGDRVKQCKRCGFGPRLHSRCDDVFVHHGDRVYNRHGEIVFSQDMTCSHCGFLNRDRWPLWPDWTGERVLGTMPPLTDSERTELARSTRTWCPLARRETDGSGDESELSGEEDGEDEAEEDVTDPEDEGEEFVDNEEDDDMFPLESGEDASDVEPEEEDVLVAGELRRAFAREVAPTRGAPAAVWRAAAVRRVAQQRNLWRELEQVTAMGFELHPAWAAVQVAARHHHIRAHRVSAAVARLFAQQ